MFSTLHINKLFRSAFYIALLLNITLNQNASSATWENISKNESVEYSYDKDSIIGSAKNKEIYIKVNILKDPKEGDKSRLLRFLINCSTSTLLLDEIKRYSEFELKGVETVFKGNTTETTPMPNTVGQRYIDVACRASSNNSANASTAIPPQIQNNSSNASTARPPSELINKFKRPRIQEFLITKSQKRPDGSIEFVEAIDISSIEPDWSNPWNVWFVNFRTGKPITNNIESLQIQNGTLNCGGIYEKYCEKGKEYYLENLVLSDKDSDYKDLLSIENNQNFSQLPSATRISILLNKWFKNPNFANGLYYDIVGFLDLTFYLHMEGMTPQSNKVWQSARDDFASFVTRISVISGAPVLDVLNYFGFSGKEFNGTWSGYYIKNNNISYSQKAREDFYLYYQAYLDKYKHARGRYQGFPHDYQPGYLLGNYFPGQFKKYTQKTNELLTIRNYLELLMVNAKKEQQKAAEYTLNQKNIKKGQPQLIEQKQKLEQFAKELNSEYPYYAIISCGYSNQHLDILTCFGNDSQIELELSNSGVYGSYKPDQIYSLGNENIEGFIINLKSNFGIKTQNSDKSLILGMKIYKRLGNELIYQKQVSKGGYIVFNKFTRE